MKIKSANGVSGCILSLMTGDIVFRVYDKDHNFIDYKFNHSDLSVTIDDEDAFFYEREDGSYKLDHSPSTLGLEN